MAPKNPADVTWERISIFAFGVIFVIALLVLAIFFPEPTPFQYQVFRIVLALAAAGVAALIPGFIKVQYRGFLQAGGALAVFVVVYFFSPAELVSKAPGARISAPTSGAVQGGTGGNGGGGNAINGNGNVGGNDNNTQGGGVSGNGPASGGPGGAGAPGGAGGTINNYYGPASSQAGSLANPDTVFKEQPSVFPTITLGCIHMMPDGELLPQMEEGQHVPLLEIVGPNPGQHVVPIKLFKKDGTLYADIELYSPKMGGAFLLRGDDFTVTATDWDANYNDFAIEITNEYGTPVFQMVRESRSSLRINGLFESFGVALAYTPQRFGRLVNNGQFVSGSFVPFNDFLQPIFKHPYWEYPRQLTANADEIMGLSQCPDNTRGRESMIGKTLVIGP